MADERQIKRARMVKERTYRRRRDAALAGLRETYRNDPGIRELIDTLHVAAELHGEAHQAAHDARDALRAATEQVNAALVKYLPDDLESPTSPVEE